MSSLSSDEDDDEFMSISKEEMRLSLIVLCVRESKRIWGEKAQPEMLDEKVGGVVYIDQEYSCWEYIRWKYSRWKSHDSKYSHLKYSISKYSSRMVVIRYY
jgi:hypothetical protein